MNNYTKRLIIYGLIQGGYFAMVMTVMNLVKGHKFIFSLTFGILSGFVFAIINILLRYKYAVPKYILNAVSVDIDLNEEIKFQTPANYTSGNEPVSGKLFLTNKRIIFRNYKNDKNVLQFSIDLEDIISVDKFKTLRIFENGLSIQTSSNEKHKFIVDRMKEWLAQLNDNIIGLQQEAC